MIFGAIKYVKNYTGSIKLNRIKNLKGFEQQETSLSELAINRKTSQVEHNEKMRSIRNKLKIYLKKIKNPEL